MMPYYNVFPSVLYTSIISGSSTDSEVAKARAWVEAENIFEVWKIVQKWFDLMKAKLVGHELPSPYWQDDLYTDKTKLTQSVADLLVKEIDEDFMMEKNRFMGRKAPNFSRLPPGARMSFAREIYRTMKSQRAINIEADERLAKGETFPHKVKK